MAGRLGVWLLWLLHWLPFPLLGLVGRVLGLLLWAINGERRRVTLTNLRLCFPALTPARREALARQHFVLFAQAILERGLAWWASPRRLRRLIRIEGLEHLSPDAPIILLAPHFVGLDMGWTRLCLERDMVTMYARVKGAAFDRALRAGRTRFGRQALFSRQDGLKPVITRIRSGHPFYYLPDLDYGPDDALFVAFFGIPAATLTALPRLAKIAGARVVPVYTRRHCGGYRVEVGPPWVDYPGGQLVEDVRRMNAEIETAICGPGEAGIAQYFWSHKRFKTRPSGEKGVY